LLTIFIDLSSATILLFFSICALDLGFFSMPNVLMKNNLINFNLII